MEIKHLITKLISLLPVRKVVVNKNKNIVVININTNDNNKH